MNRPTHSNIMTEKTKQATAAEVSALPKKREKFNHVWWLPLIALLLVVYIAINHYTSQGPLITLTFSNAEGMEAGKTKVRYKDVTIGMVEKITLNDDFKTVQLAVRMDKDSEGLLRENSRFWVVKPRIGITQISGLNTLLSGNYITIEPDKNPDSQFRYTFDALEAPPIISQDEPGLKITLLSTKAASLYPGTEIYYKGMSVGTVNRVYFSDDYLWVKADIFIAAPHDKLIRQTTKFWSSSGISIGASADGIEVNMESIEALIAGGITFGSPPALPNELNRIPVENGTEYVLYANEKTANEQNSGRKQYFVTYFHSSIKGLSVGAPVMIQGMKIGKVKDIQLLFDEEHVTTRIPVLFEIYESRLRIINSDDDSKMPSRQVAEALAARLVRDGLRTQLETGNLLTGTKYISLVFTEEHIADSRDALLLDSITGYRHLPSTLQSFDAITSGVSNLITKLNQLPINDIANNLNNLLKTTDKQVGNLDLDDTVARVNRLLQSAESKIDQLALEQTIDELNTLLKEGKALSKTAKNTLQGLNHSVSNLAKATEATMAGFSADAPLYHNLNLTLEQLNDTLESFKAVTDMLNRSPSSLVFGEEKPQTRPQKQSSDNKKSFWEKQQNDR